MVYFFLILLVWTCQDEVLRLSKRVCVNAAKYILFIPCEYSNPWRT